MEKPRKKGGLVLFLMLLVALGTVMIVAAIQNSRAIYEPQEAWEEVPGVTEKAIIEEVKMEGAVPEEPTDIAYIVPSFDEPVFQRMTAGAEEFTNNNGVEIIIYDSQYDSIEEIISVEDAIARGVDAICVYSVQPETLSSAFDKAAEAGVLTVSIDLLNRANGVEYMLKPIKPYDLGHYIGSRYGDMLGGRGEIAILNGIVGIEWFDSMYMGAEDALGEYAEIEIVATEITNNNPEKAIARTEDLIRKYPDLDGILALDEYSLLGAAQAIKATTQEDILVCGYGDVSVNSPDIYDGTIPTFLTIDWYNTGRGCVALTKALLSGESASGMDLGIDGFHNLLVDGNAVYGDATIEINADNIDEYMY